MSTALAPGRGRQRGAAAVDSPVTQFTARHALGLSALAFLTLFVLTDLRELGAHHTEWADYAADSIRARDAWTQTSGIHSRWGFHHPGPALFWLLRCGDYVAAVTGLAPVAGHLLLIAAVSTVCISTLVVELGLIERPALPPVAFILAWVLLPDHRAGMPWAPVVANWFVLLEAAGAIALVNGRRRGLPIVTLAVGVLAHLHVLAGVLGAMVGVTALGAAWHARGQFRPWLPSVVPAVAVAAALVMPPALALLNGDSPLGAYLNHSGAAASGHSSAASIRVVVTLLVPHAVGAPQLAALWVLVALGVVGTPLFLVTRRRLPWGVRVGAAVGCAWLAWLLWVSRMDFLTPENLGTALPVLVALLCLAAVATSRLSTVTLVSSVVILVALVGALDLNPFVDRWAEPLRPVTTGERAIVTMQHAEEASIQGPTPGVAIDYARLPWRTYGVASQAALVAGREGRSWCVVASRWPYWVQSSDICTAAQRRTYARLMFYDPQHFELRLPGR